MDTTILWTCFVVVCLLQWLHASPVRLSDDVDNNGNDSTGALMIFSDNNDAVHNPHRRTLTTLISPVDLIATMGSLFGKFIFNQLLDSMSDFLHSLVPGRG